jgi:hypothetical protein
MADVKAMMANGGDESRYDNRTAHDRLAFIEASANLWCLGDGMRCFDTVTAQDGVHRAWVATA